jgi:hypothetical protein
MVKTGFMKPVFAEQLERQADDVANDHATNVEGLWGATKGSMTSMATGTPWPTASIGCPNMMAWRWAMAVESCRL